MVTRTEMIEFISQVCQEDDGDVLNGLYKMADDTKLFTRPDIMGMWYGVTSAREFSDQQLNYLYAHLQTKVKFKFSDEMGREYVDSIANAASKRAAAAAMKKVTGIMEPLMGMPVYKFDAQSAKIAMAALEEYDQSNLKAVLMAVRRFVEWVALNYPEEEVTTGFHDIIVADIPMDKAVKRELYPNTLELYKEIIPTQDFDQGNVAAIEALYWYGLKVEDIVNLEKSDVDLLNGTLRVGDRTIQIDDSFILEGLRKYDSLTSFKSVRRGEVAFYACPTTKFIKRFNETGGGKEVDAAAIKNWMTRFNDKKPMGSKRITEKDVANSGAFYRLRTLERNRGLKDEDFINEFQIKARTQRLSEVKRIYFAYRRVFGG